MTEQRQINQVLLDRLHLEAEAIETVSTEFIQRETAQMRAQAAMWQPGPAPEEWEPSDISEIVELLPPQQLFQPPTTTKEIERNVPTPEPSQRHDRRGHR